MTWIPGSAQQACLDNDDGLHCEHWFQGRYCCACSADNTGNEVHPVDTTRARCSGRPRR